MDDEKPLTVDDLLAAAARMRAQGKHPPDRIMAVPESHLADMVAEARRHALREVLGMVEGPDCSTDQCLVRYLTERIRALLDGGG